jgi:hypothetical protein
MKYKYLLIKGRMISIENIKQISSNYKDRYGGHNSNSMYFSISYTYDTESVSFYESDITSDNPAESLNIIRRFIFSHMEYAQLEELTI